MKDGRENAFHLLLAAKSHAHTEPALKETRETENDCGSPPTTLLSGDTDIHEDPDSEPQLPDDDDPARGRPALRALSEVQKPHRRCRTQHNGSAGKDVAINEATHVYAVSFLDVPARNEPNMDVAAEGARLELDLLAVLRVDGGPNGRVLATADRHTDRGRLRKPRPAQRAAAVRDPNEPVVRRHADHDRAVQLARVLPAKRQPLVDGVPDRDRRQLPRQSVLLLRFRRAANVAGLHEDTGTCAATCGVYNLIGRNFRSSTRRVTTYKCRR